MRPVETIEIAHWMRDPAALAVLKALADGGQTGRFVGGAVRNQVLGLPVTDFDIATDARPSRTTALCREAGLRVIPTGIDHGTVTVVVGGTPVEVTTLRRDVETDGRRAVVAFTDDWQVDALRRDFSMNALYLDADGALYDPVGTGLADARAGRVVFVGPAADRIDEDVLRILRFFRFHAAYGKGLMDPAGLDACTRAAGRLETLSGERIWRELCRLLEAPGAADVLEIMWDVGIADRLWGHPVDGGRALALIALERRLGLPADALRRLAALVARPEEAGAVAERLRLSKAETRRLMAAHWKSAARVANDTGARASLYRDGAELFVDVLLLRAAGSGEDGTAALADELALVRSWTPPVFPLGGGDVTALGIAPGPRVGELLRAVESWWIMGDFAAEAEACRAELKRLVSEGGDPP